MDTLITEMHQNGLPPHNELTLDGTLHRYGKNGALDSKDEWYIGWHHESYIYCTYGSWSSDEKFTYKSGNITQEKTQEYEQWIVQQQKEYQKQRLQEAIEARERAQQILSQCIKKDHTYANNKGIDNHQYFYNDAMVVPFHNFDNEIQTLQFIQPDGTKKFMAKGKTHGHFHTIGNAINNTKKVYLCEGYATAHTVHKATETTTICCGSLNNINVVSVVLKGLYGHIKMSLCQDIGIKSDEHAKKWKETFNGTVHKPPVNKDGYDFNDLYKDAKWDIKEVKKALKVIEFPSRSLGDFLQMTYPEPEWIMENFLQKGSSMMIHAVGGVGKSMVALEMAIAIAQGKTFVWRIEKQHKVLFIDSELMPNLLQQRMMNVLTRRKADFDPDMFGVMSCLDMPDDTPPINLYSQEARDMLDVTIERFDVIFLDNLQNLTFDTECEGKENKAEYGQIITEWIKKWKKKGKTFVVVHHENKTGDARGSSRQNGDYDQIVRLEKPKRITEDDHGFRVKVYPTKVRSAEQKHESAKWIHLSDQHADCTIGGIRRSKETINDKFYGWLLYKDRPSNWDS